jgi:uncharacterized protein
MAIYESRITLPTGVSAVITSPVATANYQVPGILMLHGFASECDEVGGMFRLLARELAEREMVSLRIDFRGFGLSLGDPAETTIQSQLEDAYFALHFLSELTHIDSHRIGIVGFSMGGTVGILLTEVVPTIRSLVLWSTSYDVRTSMLQELGHTVFEEAKREGKVIVDLGFRRLTLNCAFFESLAQTVIGDVYAKFIGQVLVVAGDRDKSADSVQLFVTKAARPPVHLLVPGADHIFNVLTPEAGSSREVIQRTALWLSKSL